MKWQYDAEVDIINVFLSEQAPAYADELDDETVVEYAADGTVTGIEILGARLGWNPDDLASLGNEVTSQRERDLITQIVHLVGHVRAQPSSDVTVLDSPATSRASSSNISAELVSA